MTLLNVGEDRLNCCLSVKIDNAKTILQLLKAINYKDFATVVFNSKGLKVTVEDSKSVQANAFIQAEIFQEYSLKKDVTFKISLNALVECLNIFGCGNGPGVTTALKMCYNGYGFPLSLLLEEAGIITDCSLKTQDADDVLDFNFSNAGVVNKIIMKSEPLKDVFTELDVTSDILEIVMSPDPPHFRISTYGNYGINHADIPKESDVVEMFSCTKKTTNRYKLCLVKPSVKPLAASQKVSIRTDERGFVCFQFMIKTSDHYVCYIEYFCSPEEDYED